MKQSPKLELRSDCLQTPTRFDVARLEAIMLWPDDEQWRSRALESSFVEYNKPFLGEFSKDILLDFSNLAAETYPVRLIQEEVKKERFVRGVITGSVLHNILLSIDWAPESASMSVVMENCIEPFYPRWRISKKTFQNEVWPTFRPVAHFWAAALIGWRHEKDKAFPCHAERLNEFLRDAEFYRIKGEAAHTKRSPKTVLSSQTSVRLPTVLEIEPSDLTFSQPDTPLHFS